MQQDKKLDQLEQKLYNGVKVRARFARRDNEEGTGPDWSEPKVVTLDVQGYRNQRGNGYVINVKDFNWAEYSKYEYCGNGSFMAEEYRMDILEVIN